MIYQLNALIELDTRTNKVAITAASKRIVFYPGKKVAEHWCDVLVDDRPQGPFSYAKDLCKFLCQTLMTRKQVKKISKEVTDG